MVYSFLQELYIMNELPRADETMYRDYLAYIELQGLSPLIYQLLTDSGQLERTPQFFQNRLQAGRKEALYRNLLLKKESSLLFEHLEDAKIKAIPLKGTLFSETYLGHLGARFTSDIDILVRPEDVEATIALVHEMGYDLEDPINPDHFHRVFYKQRTSASLPSMIEVHWNLIKISSASLNTENLWSEAHSLHPYTYIKQLSVRHTFYTICLHGANHSMDSAKHVLDIAHLLFKRGDELDYSELFKQAREDFTLKRVQEALAIVYEFFPALHTVKPLPYTPKMGKFASWNNRLIRNSMHVENAVHCFIFAWRTVDRGKYRVKLLLNLILPYPSLAVYSLRQEQNSTSVKALIYMKLYRQRIGRLFRFLTKRIGVKTNGRA